MLAHVQGSQEIHFIGDMQPGRKPLSFGSSVLPALPWIVHSQCGAIPAGPAGLVWARQRTDRTITPVLTLLLKQSTVPGNCILPESEGGPRERTATLSGAAQHS